MRCSQIGEFELIARLTDSLASGERVSCGIGDDAAVLHCAAGQALLSTCDIQIEGIHFILEKIGPQRLGQRVAAVNLSDIAAMGGRPTWALCSLALPPNLEAEQLDAVYEGLVATLHEAGAELVGGNTARSPERLIIDLTLLGEMEPDRVLLRSGVRAGDLLCVTGVLGGSAAGLALVLDPDLDCEQQAREDALRRHFTPRALLAEG